MSDCWFLWLYSRSDVSLVVWGTRGPVKYVCSRLADLSKVLPYQQLLVHDRSYRKNALGTKRSCYRFKTMSKVRCSKHHLLSLKMVERTLFQCSLKPNWWKESKFRVHLWSKTKCWKALNLSDKVRGTAKMEACSRKQEGSARFTGLHLHSEFWCWPSQVWSHETNETPICSLENSISIPARFFLIHS